MRSTSLAALLTLLGASQVYARNPRHAEIVHKRQAAGGVTLVQAATGTDVLPLSSITFGMPSQATLPVTTTYSQGASAPVSGAPVLPTPYSAEVTEWLKELEGKNIPNIPKTVDGSCVNDTAAAADAANRGWWTCGGYTRSTDIVACPDKLTWGVRLMVFILKLTRLLTIIACSFDDGPSPYTTFFVVGSRVVERPQVLLEEYMGGHEISVHTWSHKHLTSLTNEEIVAELGWTRHAIRTVLGVTPTTMRPPYGDIDDRVRAISLAMGLVPIMWTRAPDGHQFDTNDWQVAGGMVTGPSSFATFQSILGNATTLDTGFIVLQHDLYEITVDLAVGYTLNTALTHNPAFKLEAIGKCTNTPTSNLYFESTTNTTFPSYNNTEKGFDIDGDGTVDLGGANSAGANSVPLFFVALLAGITTMLI
ncbi:hypothetical protein H0H87_000626 [Tephrocybe sp. NHM501043]|nr:hypothetical protein H0H87_000626 [Tephrocybe sp. NHM501043]